MTIKSTAILVVCMICIASSQTTEVPNVHEFLQPNATISVTEDVVVASSVFTASTSSSSLQQVYSIQQDASGSFGSFTINNVTGVVTLARSLDCEVQSSHMVVIQSILNDEVESTATSTLIVKVTDVNDNTPMFSQTSYSATVKAAPNSTVLQLAATDADCTDAYSRIQFSLKGDETGFQIDADSGVILLSEAPITGYFTLQAIASDPGSREGSATIAVTVYSDCDYLPNITNGVVTPARNDTSYGSKANVTCDRGFNTTTDVINCTVHGNWDQAECVEIVPDVHEFLQPNATISVPENIVVASSVFTASTRSPNRTQVYSIQQDDSGSFAIDAVTAVVTLSRSLDCEVQSSHTIIIQSISSDEIASTATSTLIVNVTDVNDNTPMFSQTHYSATVEALPNSTVLQLNASDADCTEDHSRIQYSLIGDESGFRISENSGVLSLPEEPTTGHFTLLAVASDPGSREGSATIAVTVYSDCGFPPNITNGVVTSAGNDTSYGSKANLTCNRGFNTTTGVINCTVHGNWDQAECIAIQCLPLRMPLNGTLTNSGGLLVDAVVKFQCDAGFVLKGNASVTCLETGLWSSVPPTCQIIDCDDPPNITHGSVTTDTGNTTFGSIAEYVCDVGYTLNGSNASVCLHAAIWDKEAPKCVIKDCKQLPFISHGSIRYTGNVTTYGSNATFSCETGYMLSHTRHFTCTALGQWNDSAPNCTINDCGILPSISHGSVRYTGNLTTYGSNATFTCETGYTLSHTRNVRCTAQEQWNDTAPNCTINDCGILPSIRHGSISYTWNVTTYGSNATFTCETGYTLSHSRNTRCTAQGQWNDTAPNCTIHDCGILPSIRHGSVRYTGNVTTYASNATFTCETGYTLSHTRNSTCNAQGQWNDTAPNCTIHDCGRLPFILHGSVIYTGNVTSYGSNVTFRCETGYTLSHTRKPTCTAQGQWNDTAPNCTINDCGILPSISHGSVNYTGNVTTYGSNATFRCETGYTLSHTRNPTCTAQGQWNGTAPNCTINDCGILQGISHGSVSYTGNVTTYGSNATFSCETGYTLSHSRNARCTAQGQWNGTAPNCTINECGILPSISHGSVSYTGNMTTYGSNATFRCDLGYTLSHSKNVRCTAQGQWNDTAPNCTINDCGILQGISHGSVSYTGNVTTYGSNATFSCETGYTLSHSRNARCTAQGQWNGTAPNCTINECGILPSISHGSVSYTGNMTTYGSNATFRCDLGYTLSHSKDVRCTAQGQWNDTAPNCTINDCGILPSISQGSVSYTGNETTYGSNATFSCETGYTLSHTRNPRCTAQGQWNDTAPNCTINDCRILPSISHGSVSYTGNVTTYGSNATFSCETGYTLSHTRNASCTAQGQWNDMAPNCKINDCGILPSISHGSVRYTGNVTTFGSNATFTCETGYTLSHTRNARCTAQGQWNGTAPNCTINDCGILPSIRHGSVSYTGNVTTYGSNATFTCETGYTRSHTRNSTCTAQGQWNDTAPNCTINDCGILPSISHGSVRYTGNDTTYGSNATFTCETGYTLLHTRNASCTAQGQWNGTAPNCTIKDCGILPSISHGYVSYTGNVTTYGSNATFSCETGYTLSHTRNARCTAQGQWNGTAPNCTINECNVLSAPSNGSVSFVDDVTTYGSTALFSCDTGYTLSHDRTLKCTAAGQWNDMAPTCIILDCNILSAPSHGRINYENDVTTYGATASFRCDTGYTLSHDRTLTCTAGGQWNDTAPTCIIQDCNMLSAPRNGSVSYADDVTTYGSTALFSCDTGYTLSHDRTLVCSASGSWNDTAPNCIIQDCNMLSAPINGSVNYENDVTTYGATASFSCDTGYTLSHDRTLACTAGGQWNDTTPTCIIQDCNTLSAPSNGTVNYENDVTTYGSIASFSCDTGYTLSHDMTLTCIAGGQWNDTAPTCILQDCNILSAPSNGSVSYADDITTYGATALFSCDTGYTLSHDRTLVCSASGSWNDTAPTCIIQDCNDFQTISHGSVSYVDDVTTYGSIAAFSCDSGYTLSHTRKIMCTADGQWNDTRPTCIINDCNALQAISHGSVSYADDVTTYGSIAAFSCETGYTLSHTRTLTCTAGGQWNDTAPTCIIYDCGEIIAPDHGTIDSSGGTTYNATVIYSCNTGYTLYGDATRNCLAHGVWGGLQPTCIRGGQPVTSCPRNTDERQTTWKETLPNQVRVEDCPSGFTGSASRKCKAAGQWQSPIYDCEREAVRNVNKKAAALTSSSSQQEVKDVLVDLLDVTTNATKQGVAATEKLTHEELTTLTSSFAMIADSITNETLDDTVQDDYFEAASSLIDDSNSDTWKDLGESGGDGAETVIAAVDTVAGVLTEKFKASGESSKVIDKKNIVVEVKRIDNEDIDFLDLSKTRDSWKNSTTSASLPKAALKGSSVIATAVVFKDMSDITKANQTRSNGASQEDKAINGPVVAITLNPLPGKLDPPLRLVFQHSAADRQNPSCSFWEESGNTWSTTGCDVVSSNASVTVCECDHLTNFAVLMSPFVEADADSTALRIISIVGIGISILCLILTLVVHFCLWRYLRSDRTTILMHLCVALLVSYVVFLAGVDRTESRVFCAIVAVLLQYIYLVVFCVMLAEGIEIAVTVLFVFVKRSRIKPLLLGAWVIPAIIVGISLGVTKAEGYGNENFCWLSVDSGLIWAFVGPAAVIILFNLVVLCIVLKVMFSTKAMEQKKKITKMKSGIRSLCVLIPLMGTTWIIGIFYINKDFYWIQYIFAICNGLQGFFIFLFHCLLNPQIKSARSAKDRRKSSTNFRSTMRTTVKGDSKATKDYSSNEISNTYLGNSNSEEDKPYNGSSTAKKYLHNGIPDEGHGTFSPPMGALNGSNIRFNTASFTSGI